MKYICFAEEVPAIIGGRKCVSRQPRMFTKWIAWLYMLLFTKPIKSWGNRK